MSEEDWRLFRGQIEYMKGITLVRRRYRQYGPNPTWDHDHCEFCWAKLMVHPYPDTLQIGYATEDDYTWVCPECFAEFRTQFDWTVIEPDEESQRWE